MVIVVTEKGGTPKRIEFQKAEITIGRVQGNDIVLPKGNVSKQHSRIMLDADKHVIVDLKSTNGTYVNSRKISGPHVVQNEDKIYIGDFMLQVEAMASAGLQAPPPSPLPVAKPIEDVPPQPMPMRGQVPPAPSDPGRLSSSPANVPPRPGVGRRPPASTMALDHPQERRISNAGSSNPLAANAGALDSGRRSQAQPAKAPASSPENVAPALHVVPISNAQQAHSIGLDPTRSKLEAHFEPPLDESDPVRADRLRTRGMLLERLGEHLDITHPGQKGGPVPELWEQAHQHICDLVQQMGEHSELPAGIDQDRLIQDARAEALAIGPLEEYLVDEDVLEIFVNGPHQILTVRRAETRLEENAFATELGLLAAINRLLGASGRALDTQKGGIDMKLRDGTRLVACFPPISSRGTTLLLRKYLREAPTLPDLVTQGFLTEGIAGFLENSLRERRPIIVAGGVESGQKILLGSLAQQIPPEERVALIEESPELAIYHPQLMQFEIRESLSLHRVLRLGISRFCIPTLLSLAPKNIETAIHSGMSGSLFGVLGQSIEDALTRMSFCASRAVSGSNTASFRNLILQSQPIFVLLNRFSDGSRQVVQVSQVGEGLALQDMELK